MPRHKGSTYNVQLKQAALTVSQFRPRSLGGRQAGHHHLLDTPDPHFTHAEVSSPLEGNSLADGCMAVDEHGIFRGASPTDGITTPAPQSDWEWQRCSDAWLKGGVVASQPHLSTFQHHSIAHDQVRDGHGHDH
jgi:hypothetical protein